MWAKRLKTNERKLRKFRWRAISHHLPVTAGCTIPASEAAEKLKSTGRSPTELRSRDRKQRACSEQLKPRPFKAAAVMWLVLYRRRYATQVLSPRHPALASGAQSITPLRGCLLSLRCHSHHRSRSRPVAPPLVTHIGRPGHISGKSRVLQCLRAYSARSTA